MTETDNGGSTTTIDWFYDELGRLTEERYDARGTTDDFVARYGFDLASNRVRVERDNGCRVRGLLRSAGGDVKTSCGMQFYSPSGLDEEAVSPTNRVGILISHRSTKGRSRVLSRSISITLWAATEPC